MAKSEAKKAAEAEANAKAEAEEEALLQAMVKVEEEAKAKSEAEAEKAAEAEAEADAKAKKPSLLGALFGKKDKAEAEAEAKKVTIAKPSGISEPEPAEIAEKVDGLANAMSRHEAEEKARRRLRLDAKERLAESRGKKPADLIGVVFLRSWKMWPVDGRTYGFSLEMAGNLVDAGVAKLAGDPDPDQRVGAQAVIDDRKALRAKKAAARTKAAEERKAAEKAAQNG